MFQKIKNIDSAFQYIKLTTICIIIGSFLFCFFVAYKSYQLSVITKNKIYVLANGRAIEAMATDRKENLAVEARDHIRSFHQYFFTLAPDEGQIKKNITQALYLADGSANDVYKNLQENNYYSGIISGNISQEINVDSIRLNIDNYPYSFQCYATEKLTRPTTITFRSLETKGFLRDVSRSDNDPHGFLIEKWVIVENRDIKTINR